jgi:hypothetical protein
MRNCQKLATDALPVANLQMKTNSNTAVVTFTALVAILKRQYSSRVGKD